MRKRHDRDQRRSRFDDDTYSGPDPYQDRQRQAFHPPSRADAAPGGPAVDAIVRWFNPEKGFGFVELADGTGDAFLHIAVLERGGHDTVLPETKLRVQVGQGQKGPQVTAVVELDASNATASRPTMAPRMSGGSRERPDPATASEIDGTVKWFNGQKGFGFVAVEDGGKDVFLHISIVDRAGIQVLPEGQQVRMRVVKTQKGREAISVALID
jgi:CspA family cold shock protein